MEQDKRSVAFYTELGVDNLKHNITPKRTKASIESALTFLENARDVLDLGCGYGRITVPLAKKGYLMSGLDITPSLIHEAKEYAKKEKVEIDFQVGDMRALPYENNSFDAVICLWAVFNELSRRSDQIRCINEIERVLKPGGKCMIEMINGERDEMQQELLLFGKGEDNRVLMTSFDNVQTQVKHYMHSRVTMKELAKDCGLQKYSATIEMLGDRERLIFTFMKQEKRS
jgi:ubiquinone/menaquinone biosynthesis C-methylase UbiE